MILEDPVPPDNVDTMAEVASKVGVPIATGERYIDLREFEVLMARHACQYVRPDVCAVGGITTSKKICTLAEAHDVLVIPPQPAGPRLHPLPACRSAPPSPTWHPGAAGLLPQRGRGQDGQGAPPLRERLHDHPEAPGIGVELADDAEELYPAKERGSTAARRAFDGAVKDW